jgi:putative ABC transport system substrate-binding protein
MAHPVRRRLVLAALAVPFAALAQGGRVRRIGVLAPTPPGGRNNMDVFFQGMQALGYVQGRNLHVEWRFSDGKEERLPALAEELLKADVELIVAAGPPATRAAKAATNTVPIVMGSADPVEQGLVASLARPGGNMTGWCVVSAEGAQKQLALLKQALPRAERVAVLAGPGAVGYLSRTPDLTSAARSLGIALSFVAIPGAEALERAFATMRQDRVDAFMVMPEPHIDVLRDRIVALAAQNRVAGMYLWRFYVDGGGLMSYGPNLRAMIALWPAYVDKILKGARPGDLPVQTPTKYELVLNQGAAAAIGFTFPSSLVLAADTVIN